MAMTLAFLSLPVLHLGWVACFALYDFCVGARGWERQKKSDPDPLGHLSKTGSKVDASPLHACACTVRVKAPAHVKSFFNCEDILSGDQCHSTSFDSFTLVRSIMCVETNHQPLVSVASGVVVKWNSFLWRAFPIACFLRGHPCASSWRMRTPVQTRTLFEVFARYEGGGLDSKAVVRSSFYGISPSEFSRRFSQIIILCSTWYHNSDSATAMCESAGSYFQARGAVDDGVPSFDVFGRT